MVKSCGNLKVRCGYRYDLKLCKRPREFKCKDILKEPPQKQEQEK